MEQEQKIKKREIGAAILLGPTLAQAMAISMIGDLNSLAYSREVESSADVTGSDICAAAGYNPWGLVWLFQEFQNQTPSNSPNCCQIIQPTGAGYKHLRRIFAINRLSFPNSTRIRNRRRRSACPRTHHSMQFLRP